MTVCETAGAQPMPISAVERRLQPREASYCDLWMIDHHGSTVLRCRCLEASSSGMRLRVPVGYGVAEGQRYELRSHLPGVRPSPGFGVIASRWVTVVRTQLLVEEDRVDVGVVFDPVESSLRWSAAPVDSPLTEISPVKGSAAAHAVS